MKFSKTREMSYLKLDFQNTLPVENDEFKYRSKPFCNSHVFSAKIQNSEKLTKGDDVKTVYQLNLALKDMSYEFHPGDAIAIFPQNREDEVNQLLIRLNIESSCDKPFALGIITDGAKKNAMVPKHIPPNSTLRSVFTNYIDIRFVPKKMFLKKLIQYTSDDVEKGQLETICSSQGSKEYQEILERNKSLLQLLDTFTSCRPPVELILEHSTPLLPRFFSIASSPIDNNIISIIFSVVQFSNGLKGICTGWLENNLKRNDPQTKIRFYLRKPTDFRISNAGNKIFIATGTGLAPFLAYLRHTSKNKDQNKTISLYYGCRYRDRDFLCENEINDYLRSRILTKIYTAFSRESCEKYYIQQEITKQGSEIAEAIVNKAATVYVCGDMKTVVKDVNEAIIKSITVHNNVEVSEAKEILKDLIVNKKYLIDSWT